MIPLASANLTAIAGEFLTGNILCMCKQFEQLAAAEQALLFKASALLSRFVSNSVDTIQKRQKKDAFRLAHVHISASVACVLCESGKPVPGR